MKMMGMRIFMESGQILAARFPEINAKRPPFRRKAGVAVNGIWKIT